MGRKAAVWSAAVAVMLALPVAASAQVQTLADHQLADIEQMGEKFIGLAEAFSAEQLEWRPMEGVRSVKEVLALAVAEANLFPPMWGAEGNSGVGANFGAEMGRVTAMSHEQVVAELDRAFAYMAEAVGSISAETRKADGNTFGQAMTNEAGIALALEDMHEHLGQLIAYARTNHVVPPWSMGN